MDPALVDILIFGEVDQVFKLSFAIHFSSLVGKVNKIFELSFEFVICPDRVRGIVENMRYVGVEIARCTWVYFYPTIDC